MCHPNVVYFLYEYEYETLQQFWTKPRSKEDVCMDRRMLFDIFKQAIKSEDEAFEFYSTAAQNAGDQDATSLFKKLADTELQHKKELEALYKTLRS